MLARLQLHRLDWRETLPLTTSEAAATSLIDGLMVVEAVIGGSVGAERLLLRAATGAWTEAVRLMLSGPIDSTPVGQVDHAKVACPHHSVLIGGALTAKPFSI